MKTKGNVYIVAEEDCQSICTNEGVRIQKDISLISVSGIRKLSADICADEEEYRETVDYFKYFKYTPGAY